MEKRRDFGTLRPGETSPTAKADGAGVPAPVPETAMPVPETAIGVKVKVTRGYRLLERIGGGAFGEVWRAEAPGGFPVAVKVMHRSLNDAESQRERQALELIRELRHPFLLQTQAFWSEEDRLFIVMELADGSLRHRAEQCEKQGLKGIPREELLDYFREAGEALDFLHANKVQHRDVKPDNLLLLGRHMKVADFGLASDQGDRSFVAVSGSGTPAYMAPEIWEGKSSVHSDQYSLAMTYAELRLNRRLFKNSHNLVSLMTFHLEERPDLKPLPEAEEQVLLRALAKDPKDRFPSCLAFAEALAQAAKPPVLPTPTRRLSARLLAVGSLAAFVCLGIVVWILTRNVPESLTRDTGKIEIPVWIPDDCEPAPEAAYVALGDHRYLDAIIKKKHGVEMAFRLIPHTMEDDRSFYMMVNKVTNRCFKAAQDDPDYIRLCEGLKNKHPGLFPEDWRKGGVKNKKDNGSTEDDIPVFRVTVIQAYCFAKWLGGTLPSAGEWDKAAGRFEPGGRLGPYQGTWSAAADKDKTQIAVNRSQEGPLEAGHAELDISPFGIRDMAGNGLEWTRTPKASDEHFPDNMTSVQLRGTSYLRPEPYVFADTHPDAGSYREGSYDISFRVVLLLDR